MVDGWGGSEDWGEGCEEEEGCWEEGWGGVREHFGDGVWSCRNKGFGYTELWSLMMVRRCRTTPRRW